MLTTNFKNKNFKHPLGSILSICEEMQPMSPQLAVSSLSSQVSTSSLEQCHQLLANHCVCKLNKFTTEFRISIPISP